MQEEDKDKFDYANFERDAIEKLKNGGENVLIRTAMAVLK